MTMLEELKSEVCEANLALARAGLVTLTWGNVSGINEDRTLVVIKPSGLDYDQMQSHQMVVVDMQGNVIEGDFRPSSDTPTHLVLYENFPDVGGITHTHSPRATTFAQARMEIPCLGTTHADQFYGPVPITRPLTAVEVEEAYEINTGKVIVERFAELDPIAMPAVLVAGHGPFTWGKNASDSVTNALALEAVAHMAQGTLMLNREASELESYILEKHYQRKHGANAYYGQKQ